MPGDVYLDDNEHYALAAKFAHDFAGTLALAGSLPSYPDEWALMESQKVRDAKEELERWDRDRQKVA